MGFMQEIFTETCEFILCTVFFFMYSLLSVDLRGTTFQLLCFHVWWVDLCCGTKKILETKS